MRSIYLNIITYVQNEIIILMKLNVEAKGISENSKGSKFWEFKFVIRLKIFEKKAVRSISCKYSNILSNIYYTNPIFLSESSKKEKWTMTNKN